ncbi:hypothetical protein GYMLUDRAFT_710618 [Collybiopsis luxurians FD-317 M1]|nr:hypothetical protein GYMLUDRAFT_710618 [Collybiopsis luxurians FD-317 M1]
MDGMVSTTDPGESLSNLLLCDGDLNGINNDTIGILYPDIENIIDSTNCARSINFCTVKP